MAASVFHNGDTPYSCKVSSVLNKDSKTYGKKFLFDGADDTCWNSDEGNVQWIMVNFEQMLSVTQVRIQFQGGFACSQCALLADSDDSTLRPVQQLFPSDTNKEQVFHLDKTASGKVFKLMLEQPTDTYGRIIIYNLDFLHS